MTIGKQIKHFRAERNFSQPELAELAGIEQSYLSKLENDKSIPSNEIFRNLLSALSVSTQEFIDSIDANESKQQLNQIPDIEQLLSQQDKMKFQNIRRYLYISSTLIILGLTLFYTGNSKQLFNETRYQYESSGIALADEPDDIFSSWRNRMDTNGEDGRQLMRAKRLEMANREDTHYLVFREYKGQGFMMDVTGGKRHYRLDKEEQIPRQINAWLQIFGVLLLCSGIMGFVLERRLSRR
ncbi:helix-turn-helix domain-containing protein [Shewanella nanhaiensis]|uniref:Helix-turn-helix domain-containing protein n=1 Tax=Shewanella nanhaiensis TaxID=2864872 RepID=A0ABS7E0I4_9GAMM|nr:helix-turn-helix transcriptional regulator [Shewanella nanhaiensis]MBW8183200.1 helix-turn-helix domain-containing protein [Shewanella nanhaiensis]